MPGIARGRIVSGLTLALGSKPKSVDAPENSFVVGLSTWAWISKADDDFPVLTGRNPETEAFGIGQAAVGPRVIEKRVLGYWGFGNRFVFG